MGREGQKINQPVTEPVDISKWQPDIRFAIYPEGARDKMLFYSPDPAPYPFLIPNHRYLYKQAFSRYPEQFWAEIIAYQVGCILNVPVPPVFVAYDPINNSCGALVEWFLNYPGQDEERFVPGGDIMVSMIHDYDRKKGQQHNFAGIERYLKKVCGFDMSTLQLNWCDMFLFDALIGNTDRHQDNWGLLFNTVNHTARMTPIFDNGTSLGYEILENKMANFFQLARVKAYIDKGHHHIRWQLHDPKPAQHSELLKLLVSKYPLLIAQLENKLDSFDLDKLSKAINACTLYQITTPLTEKRAEFVFHLIKSRYLAIKNGIR